MAEKSNDITGKIKEDALSRIGKLNEVEVDALYYVDHQVFEARDKLDVISEKIKFDKPSRVVFVDLHPGMNWAHECHYLIYEAKTGKFIKKIDAQFPYFLNETPSTLELFKTSRTTEAFKKKRRLRIPLEPGRLSSYRKLAPFPLRFYLTGRRYAILFSGSSNCRHVNDMEFLYRTLVDVYGYDTNDIYVLNRDGTLSWSPAGDWEPAVSGTYPVDGTPFRMIVNGQGNRAGFQAVMTDLATRIRSRDCLLIHTNNHGGWSAAQNDAYMSAWGGSYYASEMAADLATLPRFKDLLVVMEPCHAGGFVDPIVSANVATRTVAQAAVPWNESSAGGWFFDPWAEMWISAMAGVRGDGSALAVSPDDDLDSRTSAAEAYDYALSIDDPVMDESPAGAADSMWLSRCRSVHKFKEFKEFKEYKEFKEHKEFKEYKEFEPKGYDPKGYEPKSFDTGVEGIGPEATAASPDLETRLLRLERAVSRLQPFIQGELRPDVFGSHNPGEENEE